MEIIASDQQSRFDQVKKWINNGSNVCDSRIREVPRCNEKWP